jgi:hypothetical protein
MTDPSFEQIEAACRRRFGDDFGFLDERDRTNWRKVAIEWFRAWRDQLSEEKNGNDR